MKDDSGAVGSKKPSLPGLNLLKKVSSQETDSDSKQPNKFEALALCYANRSAALRRLCQYEDCLRDIARAARFGYPKENMFKLWERKGKCYHGLKRYELAAKCLRQSLNALKESGLSDLAKASKTTELQTLLKVRGLVIALIKQFVSLKTSAHFYLLYVILIYLHVSADSRRFYEAESKND